jgi:ferredoxin
MHHELTKALFDSYPLSEKSDFFPAYAYLKYLRTFFYHALNACGIPAKDREETVPEDIDQMLKFYVQLVGEAALSYETNNYHGKVVKLQDAIKLVTPKTDVNLSPPERVMPYKVARDVILKSDGTVAVGTCVCRTLSGSPCLPPPQEVCLFVGDPYASFIAGENPMFRRSSQEEAVKILEDSHKRGFVQTAYFKKETGNRFMAICNCCSCCCLGIKMWNQLEGTVPIIVSSGYVAEVSDDCNGCAQCADGACHFKAITMDDAAGKAVINEVKCMGCGVCEDICPIGAISLRREPSKGDPLDLEELQRIPQA